MAGVRVEEEEVGLDRGLEKGVHRRLDTGGVGTLWRGSESQTFFHTVSSTPPVSCRCSAHTAFSVTMAWVAGSAT